MSIEEQIKQVAKMAACKRWDVRNVEGWQPNMIVMSTVLLESDPLWKAAWIQHPSWSVTYYKPGTRVAEHMIVRRIGDTLHAFYENDELATMQLDPPTKGQ